VRGEQFNGGRQYNENIEKIVSGGYGLGDTVLLISGSFGKIIKGRK
jgi:hypothetical protein